MVRAGARDDTLGAVVRAPARIRAALGLALVVALGAGGCTDSGGRPGDDITDTVPVPGFVLDPTGASLSPDTSRIAVPCHDRICVWGIGGDLETQVEGGAGTAWLGDRLVVGGDRELVVDPDGERVEIPLPGRLQAVAGAEDGSAVAAVLDDAVVLVGEALGDSVVRIDAPGVVDVDLSPDGTRLALAVDEGPARVVLVERQEVLGTLGEEPATHVAWSPDGAAIATGGPAHTRVHRAEDLQQQTELDEPAVADLDYGASAEIVAIADADDGRLVLWQPGTDETTVLEVHSSASGKVLWSRGGNLYSVAPDAVLAWNTETGTVASTFDLPPFE